MRQNHLAIGNSASANDCVIDRGAPGRRLGFRHWLVIMATQYVIGYQFYGLKWCL